MPENNDRCVNSPFGILDHLPKRFFYILPLCCCFCKPYSGNKKLPRQLSGAWLHLPPPQIFGKNALKNRRRWKNGLKPRSILHITMRYRQVGRSGTDPARLDRVRRCGGLIALALWRYGGGSLGHNSANPRLYTSIQEYRNTSIQGYKHTRIQGRAG